MDVSPDGDLLDVTIAAAMHVLETGDAQAVQVLTSTRPTYQQLQRARDACEHRGYGLTVLGADGIVMRRMSDDPGSTGLSAAAPTPKHHRHGWFDHLLEMREGVR